MLQPKKYYTKFRNLTLAVDKEPESYIAEALHNGWEPMRIYVELKKISRYHKIPMVNRRTVYYWISKYKSNGTE